MGSAMPQIHVEAATKTAGPCESRMPAPAARPASTAVLPSSYALWPAIFLSSRHAATVTCEAYCMGGFSLKGLADHEIQISHQRRGTLMLYLADLGILL